MRKSLTLFLVSTSLFLLLISCESDDPTTLGVTTSGVINITQNSVIAGGNVSSDGGSEVTARGVCWSTSAEPTTSNDKIEIGSGVGSFSNTVTQLTAGTTYFLRAYATNAQGTAYGQSVSFTTQAAVLPILATVQPSATQTTADTGGEIASDGGSTITARGVCWSTSTNPTIANSKTVDGVGAGSFTSSITALTPSTTYYVRAYATNIAGTAYGNEIAFTTSVSDLDGNVYSTVHIGTQVWMKENLNTARFANGEPIATTSPATLHLGGQVSPKYQWDYNGDSNNAAVYGKLYTWYAVADDRKVCPSGWHVPSDEEWTTLEVTLEVNVGSGWIGGMLKETGTTHWLDPNTEATNSTGFTGLPGGVRDPSGPFDLMGTKGVWWSATQNEIGLAWYRMLSHDNDAFNRSATSKESGRAVRCIKD
jgi:uncharacterized protein (TIGR02145 family)